MFPLHWFISLVDCNFLLSFPKCNRRHGALFGILQVIISSTGQGGYTICTQAFLFSLANPSGLEPTKLPLKSDSHQYAILSNSGNGPTFGNGDLRIADNANTSPSSSSFLGRAYEIPQAWNNSNNRNNTLSLAGRENFVVTNYEVFGFQPWLKTDHKQVISGTLCRSRAKESNLFSWRKLSGNNLLKTAFFFKGKVLQCLWSETWSHSEKLLIRTESCLGQIGEKLWPRLRQNGAKTNFVPTLYSSSCLYTLYEDVTTGRFFYITRPDSYLQPIYQVRPGIAGNHVSVFLYVVRD